MSGAGPTPSPTLQEIVATLHDHYGTPPKPPASDPFHLILWEQVGYLVDDAQRMRAYDLLKTKVGLSPAKILAASKATLVEVTKVGGAIAASQRAERLQQSARLVVEEWDGDLRAVLELPFAEAKRALTRFPMLGDPGAEKLLLIARRHRGLALESNGLRVLVRMGYGREGKSYRATYRSVQAAIENELSHDYQWLLRAHHLLRRHGRELCRRKAPRCGTCPVAAMCAFYQRSAWRGA